MATKTKYIVFLGNITTTYRENTERYIRRNKRPWKILVLEDSANPTTQEEGKLLEIASINYNDSREILDFVEEYGQRIACVVPRGEAKSALLQKLIPHLPTHVRTPSVNALTRSLDKVAMRDAFAKYSKAITPKYEVIDDIHDIDVRDFETDLEFPVIVKPSGLAQSFLVHAAYYPEELTETLEKIQKKIKKVYEKNEGRGKTSVLIEEIIQGTQYSVDVYVGKTGNLYFCPFMKYKMAREMGYDDFFAYEQFTPATFSKNSLASAKEICRKGIEALGLRSTSAHIEIIQRDGKWKIVEIGPRIGGFRHELYELSYGINHNMNDILIRMGKKPRIPRERIGYSTVIKFYPREEGYITKIKGINKVDELESFVNKKVIRDPHSKAYHAKHGGGYVARVVLFNEDKAAYIRDRRKLEKMIKIETSNKKLL